MILRLAGGDTLSITIEEAHDHSPMVIATRLSDNRQVPVLWLDTDGTILRNTAAREELESMGFEIENSDVKVRN